MFKKTKLLLSLALLFCWISGPASAAPKTIKLKVTFVSAELIRNDHVGNEWSTSASVNQKRLTEGSGIHLTIKSTDSLKIAAEAAELDKIPDRGSGTISLKASSVTKSVTRSVNVVVKENRGRYSGNTAEWKFTFKIAKA